MVLPSRDLQLAGARILRDLVEESRNYLHLTQDWFDEQLQESDPQTEEELNRICYEKFQKLQDLMGISASEIYGIIKNYDTLLERIKERVEYDESNAKK